MTTHPEARNVTSLDLAKLGNQHLVYVKPVQHEGRLLFSVHASDGTQLWLAESREIAFASARQQGLEPLEIH